MPVDTTKLEKQPLLADEQTSIQTAYSAETIAENYPTQLLRFLAKKIYHYTALKGLAALGATLVADVQAVFSYFAFTGFVDCSKGQPRKEDEFYLLYYILLAICFSLTIFLVVRERPLKLFKSLGLIGRGAHDMQYPRSPQWIKNFNRRMALPSVAVTGWNLTSMLGHFPKNSATLQCVEAGWTMSLETGAKSAAGVIAGLVLAAPQIRSYYGRATPLYGDTMTAGCYAIFKVAMSMYPIIRDILKNSNGFNPEEHIFKFVAIIFMTLNRFHMYHVSNKIIYITTEFKTTNEFEEAKAKFNCLEPNEKQNKLRKEGLTLLVNKQINDMHLKHLKSRGYLAKLYFTLLPYAGCASVAYITVLSLEAIAKAMNVHLTPLWQHVLQALAGIFSIAQLQKYATGTVRAKTVPPEAYEQKFNRLLDQYHELTEAMPPSNVSQTSSQPPSAPIPIQPTALSRKVVPARGDDYHPSPLSNSHSPEVRGRISDTEWQQYYHSSQGSSCGSNPSSPKARPTRTKPRLRLAKHPPYVDDNQYDSDTDRSDIDFDVLD